MEYEFRFGPKNFLSIFETEQNYKDIQMQKMRSYNY